MAKRPPKGLSIEDAFRRYADPALLARLDELEPHANGFTVGVTEHLHNEYQGLHDAIAQSLIRRLQRGELITRGLVRGAPVAQGKVDVDPDWWAELEICFELDEICGPKRFVMTAVEIREAEPDDAEGQASSSSGQPTLAHSGDQVRADRGFLHLSETGEVLTVGTTRMVFRGSVHKAIVRQLVQAHAKNEWVRTADLLQRARSRSDTLAKAFSGSRNWPTLQTFLCHRNGYTWLEV
jgi:hypothetical protein